MQKESNRYITYKELLRSYVELVNSIKALEEKFHTQQIEN